MKQRPPQSAIQNLNTPTRQSHPTTLIRRAGLDPRSLSTREVAQLHRAIGNRAVGRLSAQAQQSRPAHDEQTGAGLPAGLKAGVEMLSGLSLDDVRVHYNSAEPDRLQATAYTRGTEIHVGPGQEEHLPHEAWHVVQQKQGRVSPNTQLKGVSINDDAGLESEADVMGARAARGFTGALRAGDFTEGRPELRAGSTTGSGPVQRNTKMYIEDTGKKGAGILTAWNTSTGKKLGDLAVSFGPLKSPEDAGTGMEAWLYPNDAHRVNGSPPSVRPSWWQTMHNDPHTDSSWVSNNVVQGHLLNEKLGGPGNDMRNLTPFAKDTNSKHHSEVEKRAKAADSKGLIIHYIVTVDYSLAPNKANFGNKIPQKYLNNFPYKINYEYEEFDPSTRDAVKGTRVTGEITNAISGQ